MSFDGALFMCEGCGKLSTGEPADIGSPIKGPPKSWFKVQWEESQGHYCSAECLTRFANAIVVMVK